MAEYAGRLRGLRVRRRDEEAERSGKFSRRLQASQHKLARGSQELRQKAYDRQAERQARSDERTARLDKISVEDRAERKRIGGIREKRETEQYGISRGVQKRALEDRQKKRDTQESTRRMRRYNKESRYDLLNKIYSDAKSGKWKEGQPYQTEDRNRNVVEFSSSDIDVLSRMVEKDESAKAKIAYEEAKYTRKRADVVEDRDILARQTLRKSRPLAKLVKGYFLKQAAEKYDTAQFGYDDKGEYTRNTEEFFDNVQAYQKKGYSDEEAIDAAAEAFELERLGLEEEPAGEKIGSKATSDMMYKASGVRRTPNKLGAARREDAPKQRTTKDKSLVEWAEKTQRRLYRRTKVMSAKDKKDMKNAELILKKFGVKNKRKKLSSRFRNVNDFS